MSRTTSSRRATTPPPTRKPPTAWIIGGVVALILVIAAIVAITSSGDDDGADTAPAATTAAGADTDPDDETPDDETPDDETQVSISPASAGTTAPAGATPGTVVGEVGDVVAQGTPLPPFEGGDDPAVGLTAPTLAGLGFDGSPRSIAPGRPTFVVFLAHWCPHCQREVPRLVEWSESGGVPEGMDVIAVATATNPQRENFPPSEWLAEEQWPHDVLLDDARSTAAAAYGLSAYPFFTLLDEEGRVVLRDSGEIDTEGLTERITDALAD